MNKRQRIARASKAGKARAKKLTRERRIEIAIMGAKQKHLKDGRTNYRQRQNYIQHKNQMKIDLNKQEIELIDKALQSWETDATSGAIMGSMFALMLCPPDARDEAQAKSKTEMEEASKENQRRRIQGTLLRAKLFQALNRDSEFPTGAEAVISVP